ncbi:MAG: hypothetical protein ABL892_06200, partial [Thiobacillaceae bacterium]
TQKPVAGLAWAAKSSERRNQSRCGCVIRGETSDSGLYAGTCATLSPNQRAASRSILSTPTARCTIKCTPWCCQYRQRLRIQSVTDKTDYCITSAPHFQFGRRGQRIGTTPQCAKPTRAQGAGNARRAPGNL